MRRWLAFALVAFAVLVPRTVLAQAAPNASSLHWNEKKTRLLANLEYRNAIDANTRRKLSRGLPTTIVLTAAVYVVGSPAAVSTTAQTCKVTWLVWDEVYQVEIVRPDSTRVQATLDVPGVVKRCAEAKNLPIATSSQVTPGASVYLNAKVQVNPVSPAVVEKIKKWVSRPTGTGTAAPGDALFSTFTGLFLQRIGDAEAELKFTSASLQVPRPPKPAPAKPKKKP